MTFSIIQKSHLEDAKRIDAEYFEQKYLEVEKRLNSIPTKTISDISKKVVNFGAYSLCNFIIWQDEGIPYLNVQNIKEGFIDFTDVKFIDEKVNGILNKSQVNEGDLILTMAGTIGNVAVAHKLKSPVNSNQATAKITLKKEFSPYFLSAFFNCYYGKSQIIREIVSSVQPNIFLWQIKNFKIPIVPKEMQEQIENIYLGSLNELNNSKSLYSQAENLLLEKLGLKDFKFKDDLFFVVDSSKTKGRIDADYFQPKYEQLIEKLKLFKTNRLEDYISNYSTGFTFKSDNYQEEGIPLIRINNIKKGLIDLSDTVYLSEKDFLLSPKDEAKTGDIVLSMSGSIGLAAIIPSEIPKCSVNQRILKFTSKNINKEYLVLVLNSIVGNLQLERIGTGGVQTNISYNDIKKILIPELETNIQQKIAELVKKSHEARKKSKELLQEAKMKVEEMIEKGSSLSS